MMPVLVFLLVALVVDTIVFVGVTVLCAKKGWAFTDVDWQPLWLADWIKQGKNSGIH